MHVIRFQRLALKPRLFVADHFIGCEETETLLEVARQITDSRVGAAGTLKHDETGTSLEMPVDCNRVVTAVAARMRASFGFANSMGDTMRYRCYRLGESHPLHSDCYEIEGHFLVVTAMLCLTASSDGGETHFPNAKPSPILLRPQQGRLAVWLNYLEDGSVDRHAIHEALPVNAGTKVTLTNFVYGPMGSVPIFSNDLLP